MLEAIRLYASRAAEKLRAQHHLALTIHVFIHTSPFEPNFHAVSDMAQLPYPTDDTRKIVAFDGCKMSSNASKEWSGTFKELEEKQQKIQRQIRSVIV